MNYLHNVCFHKQLIRFQKCFSVLFWLCQVKGYKMFSHFRQTSPQATLTFCCRQHVAHEPRLEQACSTVADNMSPTNHSLSRPALLLQTTCRPRTTAWAGLLYCCRHVAQKLWLEQACSTVADNMLPTSYGLSRPALRASTIQLSKTQALQWFTPTLYLAKNCASGIRDSSVRIFLFGGSSSTVLLISEGCFIGPLNV